MCTLYSSSHHCKFQMPLRGKDILLITKVRPQKREKVTQAISQIMYFLHSLQGHQRT